jgi:hypothetical protein
MSYVLGYIYADGSLENSPKIRGLYVRVSSTDKETIERIKLWLSSDHTTREEISQWKNGKKRYLLRIGNQRLYGSLTKLGLYPRKSLTIEMPNIPKKYFLDFVRGYFDGDGCVYPYFVVNKNNIMYARKLCVIFTSGSREYLIQLSQLLHVHIGLRPLRPLRNTRSFQLRYSTNDSLEFFNALYKNSKKGDYLERKYDKFQKFLAIRATKMA